MTEIFAAIHGHSKHSDGQNTPRQIVEEAIKKNISYLAITDHDNVNGIPHLYESAQNTSVIPIAGIEFLTKDGDLLALKPTPLNQAIPFLKWCMSIKAKKMSALDIIITGLKKYDCLFVIPHPELFINSLRISTLKEIFLSLTPTQRARVAIELNNGATQVLNNKKRLDKINKFIKKYPFHLINGPDYHHKRWLTLGTSSLPQHTPSYDQFLKQFISGQFSHSTPPKLTFKQTLFVYYTQLISFAGSRLAQLFHTEPKRKVSPQLATLLANT